jgi:hypothetical protein
VPGSATAWLADRGGRPFGCCRLHAELLCPAVDGSDRARYPPWSGRADARGAGRQCVADGRPPAGAFPRGAVRRHVRPTDQLQLRASHVPGLPPVLPALLLSTDTAALSARTFATLRWISRSRWTCEVVAVVLREDCHVRVGRETVRRCLTTARASGCRPRRPRARGGGPGRSRSTRLERSPRESGTRREGSEGVVRHALHVAGGDHGPAGRTSPSRRPSRESPTPGPTMVRRDHGQLAHAGSVS